MKTPAPIAVLGAGAYGTALAIVVGRTGRAVHLWGRDAAEMARIAASRENGKFLPGAPLPDSVTVGSDLAALADASLLVLAVPTQSLRALCRQLGETFPCAGKSMVAAAKGIEQDSGRFVCEVIRAELPQSEAAILSGPSFAADMARALPTAVTLAARTNELAESFAEALGSALFRIYHSDDIRGVEIGGAAKNVLAIAAGIVAGAGLGESARAALITRGFAELSRFARACGARPETLMGLSGLGDLLLTASSPQSRNYALGHALGQGKPLEEAMQGKLAEGAFTAPVLARLAREHQVEMPVSLAVAAILSGKLGVREAIAALIERPRKSEL